MITILFGILVGLLLGLTGGGGSIFAVPMLIFYPLQTLISNLDRTMLQNLAGTKEVGIFFAMQSVLAILNSVSSSAMTVLLPKVSRVYAAKRFDDLRQSVMKSVRYLSILIVPCAVLIIMFRDVIISILFGPSFLDGGGVLVVFSFAFVVAALTRPYANILYGAAKHHWLVINYAINLAVIFFSNLYLIPKVNGLGLGATGAAISNLSIWLISGIFQVFLAKKYVAVPFETRVFKHII